jgi:predicted MPP superfamily phosphohydrolase
MKILAIGDIHGRDIWKEANFGNYDKVVFIGDYVDSYSTSDWDTFLNLKEIIEQKKAKPDKIVLLLGNHDIQYLHFPLHRCSGFRQFSQNDLTALFVANKDLFQVAFQVKNYLFTHAGVSRKWYNQHLHYFTKDRIKTVGEVLNAMYLADDEDAYAALFQVGYLRGGDGLCGGIVWADQRETKADFLFGHHQIVGHSPVPDIDTVEFDGMETSITYIDVLRWSDNFYTVEI